MIISIYALKLAEITFSFFDVEWGRYELAFFRLKLNVWGQDDPVLDAEGIKLVNNPID